MHTSCACQVAAGAAPPHNPRGCPPTALDSVACTGHIYTSAATEYAERLDSSGSMHSTVACPVNPLFLLVHVNELGLYV